MKKRGLSNETSAPPAQPLTLKALKREATRLKKERGIPHSDALEAVSEKHGFANYHDTYRALLVPPTEPAYVARVTRALAQHGSREYITASGPLLELLSDMAMEGDLNGMWHAYNAYTKVHPECVRRVIDSIPAKVLNHYWINRLGLAAGKVIDWTGSKQDWAERMNASFQSPGTFEHFVNNAHAEMLAWKCWHKVHKPVRSQVH